MSSVERRHLVRFEIPGAQISYKQNQSFALFSKYSKPMPLKDITKNGACIGVSDFFNPGDPIEIKLLIPGERRIRVKGKIIWSSQLAEYQASFAGIQFLPFGEGKHYNSFWCRQKLEQLTNQYLEKPN